MPVSFPLADHFIWTSSTYGEYVRPLQTDDIGDQHEWLLDMEDKIKTAIIPGHGWRAKWIETVWDEDRIPGLKLLASRF